MNNLSGRGPAGVAAMLLATIGQQALICSILLSTLIATPPGVMGQVPGQAAIGLTGSGFIRVQDEKFVDKNCQEVVFSGWNSWDLVGVAAGTPSMAPYQGDDRKNMGALRAMFKEATANGLVVARVFGHGVDDSFVLQPKAGVYNEDVFRGVDRVLASAQRSGVKMILTLADSWKMVDSKYSYVNWSKTIEHDDEFFSDSQSKMLFKQHITAMVNRLNTVTKLRYKKDPAIFAWNLINEPRCHDCQKNLRTKGACSMAMDEWVAEMANHLKTQDPNHMVTVGQEGFFGPTSPYRYFNPSGPAWKHESTLYKPPMGTERCGSWDGVWADFTGQDFVNNHMHAAIDYASFHMWPDNWVTATLEFVRAWVDIHVKLAKGVIHKPLVFEEFGRAVPNATRASIKELRDPLFEQVYAAGLRSMKEDGPLKGVMFWEWDINNDVDTPGPFFVKTSDSTFQNVVIPFSKKIHSVMQEKPLVNYCMPGDTRSYQVLKLPPATVKAAGAVVYVTPGPNIIMKLPGLKELKLYPLDSQRTITDCAFNCIRTVGCNTFEFGQARGSCVLYQSEASSLAEVEAADVGWSTEAGMAMYAAVALAPLAMVP